MGFTLFKKIVSKKAGDAKDKFFSKKEVAKPRVDGDLPLDLRHGSKVSISMAELVLYRSKMLVEKFPKDMYVLGFSKIDTPDLFIHRFYLGETTETQAMLQIITDKETGEIDECRIFTTFDEVYPEDAEDWAAWMDEGGLIGYEGFQIDAEEVNYGRVWECEGPEWVEPPSFNETINLDPCGENTERIDIPAAMLFGRYLDDEALEDGPAEFLIAQVEELDDEAYVHLMVGVDVNPASVKVAF